MKYLWLYAVVVLSVMIITAWLTAHGVAYAVCPNGIFPDGKNRCFNVRCHGLPYPARLGTRCLGALKPELGK
ncbi:hypothetical protein HGA64_02825 [Candidatus Falkowbacteria bacterium]|nr:hypothetical protein [Candidatus Falkowbacteria bacterium]